MSHTRSKWGEQLLESERQCGSMASLGLLLSALMYAWVPEHAMAQMQGEAWIVTRGVGESVDCRAH